MAKQTMKIRSTRANVANSTEHLNAPSVPIKTALEMAMEKSGLLVDADKPKTVDVNLVEMYQNLEQQMLLLRAAIHYDKIEKGIINVDQSSPFCVAHPEPIPEPVNYKTGRFLLDSEIPILGKTKTAKPKTYNVKAESIHADEFDESFTAERERVSKLKPHTRTTTVKAESTQPKAGREAFTTTFRDAVMEAFKMLKPGQQLEAHTVNAEDPTSTKYRVYFDLAHLGSTIMLNRKSKKAYKAFTVEIPLSNGKLNPEMIPAYASKK